MCDKIKHLLLDIECAAEQWLRTMVQFFFFATVQTVMHGGGFVETVANMIAFWVRTYHWFTILSVLLLIIIMVEVRIEEHHKRTARRAAEVAHIA